MRARCDGAWADGERADKIRRDCASSSRQSKRGLEHLGLEQLEAAAHPRPRVTWRDSCQRIAKLKDDKNRLDRNYTETRKELDQVSCLGGWV